MNNLSNIPTMKPGIYLSLDNDAYHAGPGISKSGLWTIDKKSPAHFKFPAPKSDESSQAIASKDLGTATHVAVLEPERFEKAVFRGPNDRRGNKWADAAEFCKAEKKTLLVADAYDSLLALRDAVHADAWINNIITSGDGVNEASGYWIDPETGELCRCRPDRYRRDIKLILDVKTAASAHPDEFARSAINFGYHSQEAFYTDGWNACLGSKRSPDMKVKAKSDDDVDYEIKGTSSAVEAFAFLVLEKARNAAKFSAPFAFGVYELPPSIVEEGRAIMRKSLNRYAECKKVNRWPAYGEGVQELSFKRWNYRLTEAPTDEAEAA